MSWTRRAVLDTSMRIIIRKCWPPNVPSWSTWPERRPGSFRGGLHHARCPHRRHGAGNQHRRRGSRPHGRSDGQDDGEEGHQRCGGLTCARSREAWRPIDLAEEWVRKATAKTETEALKAKLIDFVSPKLDTCSRRLTPNRHYGQPERSRSRRRCHCHSREMNLREKVLKIIADPTVATCSSFGLAGLYFEFSTPGAVCPGFWWYQSDPGSLRLPAASIITRACPHPAGDPHVRRRDQGGLSRRPDAGGLAAMILARHAHR